MGPSLKEALLWCKYGGILHCKYSEMLKYEVMKKNNNSKTVITFEGICLLLYWFRHHFPETLRHGMA